MIEWVEGISVKPPGIYNQTYSFFIVLKDYNEEILPVGEYSLWFDFTNCSIVPVPVIVEKLIISVTENNVTYFFEYDNREDIYTLEITNYWICGVGAIFIVTLFFEKSPMRGFLPEQEGNSYSMLWVFGWGSGRQKYSSDSRLSLVLGDFGLRRSLSKPNGGS